MVWQRVGGLLRLSVAGRGRREMRGERGLLGSSYLRGQYLAYQNRYFWRTGHATIRPRTSLQQNAKTSSISSRNIC